MSTQEEAEQRKAKLDANKRRLVEELMRRKRAAAGQVEPTPSREVVLTEAQFGAGTGEGEGEAKQEMREFYNRVSTQLDAGLTKEHALFLNFGYVPNDNPQRAIVRLPDKRVNRNTIRLVLELVGDAPLRPTDRVLDVGCGRGGTISVLREFFQVGPVVGLDLSSVAIASNRARLQDERTTFIEGDAEALPFEDDSFDVVTNVESSHAYPNCGDFYEGVARVLRPDGLFLYTDMLAREHLAKREQKLAELGFVCERRQDITANVLLSCDETARVNLRTFSSQNDRSLLERFLGAPNSDFYNAMKQGDQRYMLYRYRYRPADLPREEGASRETMGDAR